MLTLALVSALPGRGAASRFAIDRHFGDGDRGGAFRRMRDARGRVRCDTGRRGRRRLTGSGTYRWLPGRDVEPLRVELLVERQVMGGEPRQLVGALDGVRVHALALLEGRAGADVRVPA